MITDKQLVKRLKTQGADEGDRIVDAAAAALGEQAQPGEWFTIKAPRKDNAALNRAKSGELDRAIASVFGKGGDEEKLAPVALEAIARAIIAEIVEGGDKDGVTLGGVEYAARVSSPARGGRARLGLKAPEAEGAAEAAEGETEAEDA